MSLKPNCFPDILNAWHGNPAHNISCGGISFSSISVMSPKDDELKLLS